jgi:hypothetical protein
MGLLIVVLEPKSPLPLDVPNGGKYATFALEQ